MRGRPLFAEGELRLKTLGDLTPLPAAMGTKIAVKNGIGYVELSGSTNQ